MTATVLNFPGGRLPPAPPRVFRELDQPPAISIDLQRMPSGRLELVVCLDAETVHEIEFTDDEISHEIARSYATKQLAEMSLIGTVTFRDHVALANRETGDAA